MNVEELRRKYRPDKVLALFVGESAPAGGTFFYAGNSQMYRYVRPGRSRGSAPCQGRGCGRRGVLVTSANLTEAALDRNIEVGLLVRDRALAATVSSHFRGLIDRRLLHPLPMA